MRKIKQKMDDLGLTLPFVVQFVRYEKCRCMHGQVLRASSGIIAVLN